VAAQSAVQPVELDAPLKSISPFSQIPFPQTWEKKLEADEEDLPEEELGDAQTGANGHPLLSNSHSLSTVAYPNGQ